MPCSSNTSPKALKVAELSVKASEKIQIIFDSTVESINGTEKVESVLIRNKNDGSEQELMLDGVFIAVGNVPNIKGITGLPDQDEAGYIIAGENCETSIPGIFAAGDVRTKQLRQVITATADGANAITSVDRYLQK